MTLREGEPREAVARTTEVGLRADVAEDGALAAARRWDSGREPAAWGHRPRDTTIVALPMARERVIGGTEVRGAFEIVVFLFKFVIGAKKGKPSEEQARTVKQAGG